MKLSNFTGATARTGRSAAGSLGALGIILLGAIACGDADAAPVRWTLQGVSLSDGETVAGSFVFDADTLAVTDVSIETSGGKIFNQSVLESDAQGIWFGTAPLALGTTVMELFFLPNVLTDQGGLIPLEPGSTYETCNIPSPTCSWTTSSSLNVTGFVTTTTDTYDAANRRLTIPALAIGSATYSNVVVTVGNIISGPTGTTPNGGEDSYDPGTKQATLQSVILGSTTYHNVIVAVADLISIGNVTGTDTYSGGALTIPAVQIENALNNGNTFCNVVITPGKIIGDSGGMPTISHDQYNPANQELEIPAVTILGNSYVYTNVVITVSKVLAYSACSGGSPGSEIVLHSFGAGPADGIGPSAPVINGSDNNFYGTTTQGGQYGKGTVFKVTPGGVETVLYSFGAAAGDGATPYAGLVQGSDGNFYGTTENGGASGAGTVFKVTPGGVEAVLYSFKGYAGSDGSGPQSTLIQGSDGNFYGTTTSGGANTHGGTVFKITPEGVESVLYSFTRAADPIGGIYPYGLIQGSDGNLYGVTQFGGANDAGTVFKMTPAGVMTWVYFFGSSAGDGANPMLAGLIQGRDDNFYGTTSAGGQSGNGTVFRITSGGVESVLYTFGSQPGDGGQPWGGLLLAADGNLYGTTIGGGTSAHGTDDNGTVFKLTPAGVETVLYAFGGFTVGDGAFSEAGLVQDEDGNLYGTTSGGGTTNNGAVFRVIP